MSDSNQTQPQQNKIMRSQLDAAAISQPGQTRMTDGARELLSNVEQLLNANRRIELVQNSDGTIDVRCGGIAAYGRGLRNALQSRVDIEAARVTDRIMGEQAGSAGTGAISGGSLGIAKTRP